MRLMKRLDRMKPLLCVLALAWSACGKKTGAGGDGDNGETTGDGDSSGGDSGGGLENPTPPDAPQADPMEVTEVPGDEDCPAWQPAARPTAELPDVHENEYELELDRWEISNASGDPIETRTRMNDALIWASENGFDKVIVPTGTYLVGEVTNDAYAGGIELPENMTLELAEGAVIQMATNDRWNYCVIVANDNTTIRGGEIVGDRATHIYETSEPEGDDEGHGICVWTAIDRVLIEDMEIHELTGDGVLIVGSKGAEGEPDAPSTNITIRRNDIHHNRRQGISSVGGHRVIIEENRIHHIEGTSPQFGIDIEGAGRTDENILIYRNEFHDNAGGDVVTSTGKNVWIEENTMTQCQVNEAGEYDPALPCDLSEQVDGPIVLWKETDNVIINNKIRMSLRTVNGFWGIIGYTPRDGAVRENPIGNYIAGNTFYDAGIHMAHNMRTFLSNNTLNEGVLLGYLLGCTRLEHNRINRTQSENYKLRNVAGVANGNILNKGEGAPPADDVEMHFPMANDAPYRNSSPVFW